MLEELSRALRKLLSKLQEDTGSEVRSSPIERPERYQEVWTGSEGTVPEGNKDSNEGKLPDQVVFLTLHLRPITMPSYLKDENTVVIDLEKLAKEGKVFIHGGPIQVIDLNEDGSLD